MRDNDIGVLLIGSVPPAASVFLQAELEVERHDIALILKQTLPKLQSPSLTTDALTLAV